jgi:hypothetical protein
MDLDQLRAVVKYYFIFKRVDTQVPWLVHEYFITSLIAGCKVARVCTLKMAANSEKQKSRGPAANNAYSIDRSVSQPRPKEGRSAVKVNGQLAAASPPTTMARRTPQPTSHRAPTVSMVPAVQGEDPASLFVPEGSHKVSADYKS